MDRTVIPLTRRLGAIEVLDAAIWFIRDHFAAWLLTAASGSLVVAVLVAFLFNVAVRHGAHAQGATGLVALAVAGAFVGRGVCQWAGLEYLKSRIAGESVTPEACLARGLKQAPRALFFSGWTAMCQWIGLLLCVYPGMVVVGSWGLGMPAAVFEDLDPVRALRRSRTLAAGSTSALGIWGLLLGIWAILFANALMLGSILTLFLHSFLGLSFPRLEQWLSPGNPIFLVLAIAGSWAAADTIRTAAFGVLYLNARLEHEGSDLLARIAELRQERRARAEVHV